MPIVNPTDPAICFDGCKSPIEMWPPPPELGDILLSAAYRRDALTALGSFINYKMTSFFILQISSDLACKTAS
jgi:hypothetical protein